MRPRQPPAFTFPREVPERVMVYDQFAQMYGWSPRQVDELTLDELQWLPVVRQAKTDAAEQIAAARK